MGLCKCPKKKVTNLFCFEHRVNVCEHCLVANHNKCIVQSYLHWLQDSDYSPNCTLCSNVLSDEAYGECVRLTCYDVFHFACLNQYAQKLPANTAPAGYTCPTCNAGIFPPANMVSPVADVLREMLSKVNWARAGLGLPLIEEPVTLPAPPPSTQAPTPSEQTANHVPPTTVTSQKPEPAVHATPLKNLTTLGSSPAPNTTRPSAQVSPYNSSVTAGSGSSQVHSVINVDEGTSVRGQEKPYGIADPRKLFDSTKEDLFNLSHDHDEDKYKRRPALDWLNRWLRSRDTYSKRGIRKEPTSVRKKFLWVLLIGIIGFITLIIIFSKLGEHATDGDPAFDPLANPNIKIGEHEVADPLLDNMAHKGVIYDKNEVPAV